MPTHAPRQLFPLSSEAKWNEAAADGKVSKEVWDKWIADETVAANATAAAEGAMAAIDTGGDGQPPDALSMLLESLRSGCRIPCEQQGSGTSSGEEELW